MKVEVIKCSNNACKHEFQDKVYGTGMRVMNPTGKMDKGGKDGTHKCTVCSKNHTIK